MKSRNNDNKNSHKPVFLLIGFLIFFAVLTIIVRYSRVLSLKDNDVDYVSEEKTGTYFTVDAEKLRTSFTLAKLPTISKKAGMIPVRRVIRMLETTTLNGREWALVEYGGISGWLSTEKIYKISDEDISIQAGSRIFVATGDKQYANLYSKAGWEKEALIEAIPYGTELEVQDVEEGWGKVECEGKTGWVNLHFVSTYCSKKWTAQSLDPEKKGISLLKEGKEDAKVVSEIPNDQKIEITEFKNGWGKTEYKNKTGWVKLIELTAN